MYSIYIVFMYYIYDCIYTICIIFILHLSICFHTSHPRLICFTLWLVVVISAFSFVFDFSHCHPMFKSSRGVCEGTDISYLLVHCTMTYYVYLSTVVRVCTHWSWAIPPFESMHCVSFLFFFSFHIHLRIVGVLVQSFIHIHTYTFQYLHSP